MLLVRPQRQIQLIDAQRLALVAEVAVKQINGGAQPSYLLRRLSQRPVQHLLAAVDHTDLVLQLLVDLVVEHVDAASIVAHDDALLADRDAHLLQELDGVEQALPVGFKRLLFLNTGLFLLFGLVQ